MSLALTRKELIRPQNLIDGKWIDAADSARFPVTNPATGEVTGEVALGSVEDAQAVIAAAAAAFPAWRDTSLAKRTQIMAAWAAFATTKPPAKVVSFNREARAAVG